MSLKVWTRFYSVNLSVTQDQRRIINACKKDHLKIARTFNHLAYLQRCKRYNLIPKTFLLNIPFRSKSQVILRRKIGNLLLCQRIKDLHAYLNVLKEREMAKREALKKCLPDNMFVTVWLWILCIEREEFEKVQRSQKNKFQRLWQTKHKKDALKDESIPITQFENKVINVSSHQLTSEEENLLRKGLGYTMNGNPAQDFEFAVKMEYCAQKFEDGDKVIREVEMKIEKGGNRPTQRKYGREKRILQGLSDNKNIVVLKADKGGSVVIMDKDKYISKTEEIFVGGGYIKLLEDPTMEIEEEILETLNRYVKKNWIDKEVIKRCKNGSLRVPTLYTAPKVHKEGMPMRPIVSTFDTLLGTLSKWLLEILDPLKRLFKNLNTSVLNTKEVVDYVRELKDNSYLVVSFDVVNLFGSLSIDRVLDVLEDLLVLDSDLVFRTNLPVSKILNLVSLCLKNSYFLFQGEFYLQVEGIAMGSPLSPLVAELYLRNFEQNLINEHNFSMIKKWSRYVDDVLSFCIGNRENCEEFLKWLNERDPTLTFTMEVEENGQLPFLDIMIQREENGFSTSMYKKPISSETCLNFESHQHISVKKGIVKGYVNRILHCSDNILEDKKKLKEKLTVNGYPGGLVEDVIDNYKGEKQRKEQNAKKCFGVPYERGITDKLKVKPGGKNKLVYQRGRSVGEILSKNFKEKEFVDKERGGVVYKVNCKDCNKVYIGETGRYLSIRINEHRRRVINKDRCNGIAVHVLDYNHEIDWENVSILAREPEEGKRKIKEAMFIATQEEERLMNLNNGIKIKGNWKGCLDKIKYKI